MPGHLAFVEAIPENSVPAERCTMSRILYGFDCETLTEEAETFAPHTERLQPHENYTHKVAFKKLFGASSGFLLVSGEIGERTVGL